MIRQILILVFSFVIVIDLVVCTKIEIPDESIGRQLIEQGRTFVHHAVKRMAIILPLIFFKLGISFTLLLLVTIVSINNGFIGFMLLVVGLSSVLARLQEVRTPAVQHIPVAYPPPPAHYGHFLDRSDTPSLKSSPNAHTSLPYTSYAPYTPYTSYTPYTDVIYTKYT